MTQILFRQKFIPLIGLVFSLPALFYIIAAQLELFGYPALYRSLEPILGETGVQHPMGWNLNFYILFGPVLAFVLNVLTVMHIQIEFTKERFDCRFTLVRSWRNLAVAFLSTTILLFFIAFALGENCNCN
ncbi:MAG: hypothetical protein H7Y31_16540 [Chitinophagaceae bacterium]|nr:hypothetical protein [Chitinophagaceae bacterium]